MSPHERSRTSPPPTFKMTETAERLFSTASIVRMLVKMRMRMATLRHSRHFYRSISDNPKILQKKDAPRLSIANSCDVARLRVSDCVPGRRYWPHPKRKIRLVSDSEKAQENALVAMMLRDIEDGGYVSVWKDNLLALCCHVKKRIEGNDLSFERPRLHLLAKRGKGAFRCLATYENLADRIIIGRLAMHLRSVFDPQMRDNSYAFRKNGAIKHLTAIRRLKNFRMKYYGKKLYVAECDIQKFFDSIHHDVTLDAFDAFAAANGSDVEPWMRQVVCAYLESYYSFRNLAEDADVPEEQKGMVGFYSSEEFRKALIKIYGKVHLENLPIGIPQGGALSPLLINLVLHRADEAVLSGDDEELFYARYCDDMVIVHPDSKKCKAAFDRYLMMMESLRLPVHPVMRGMRYGKGFFDGKSKGPYAWTDCRCGTLRSSPWVSFLGEQIRFDGEVRIRQESIETHRLKLWKEKGLLQRAIGKSGAFLKRTLEAKDVFDRFCSRLVAVGVGYSPWERMGDSKDRCWIAAFPGISDSPRTRLQMKRLDRSRDSVLCAVRNGCLNSKDDGGPKRFLGKPFSYRGFLEREERSNRHDFMNGVSAYGEW